MTDQEKAEKIAKEIYDLVENRKHKDELHCGCFAFGVFEFKERVAEALAAARKEGEAEGWKGAMNKALDEITDVPCSAGSEKPCRCCVASVKAIVQLRLTSPAKAKGFDIDEH